MSPLSIVETLAGAGLGVAGVFVFTLARRRLREESGSRGGERAALRTFSPITQIVIGLACIGLGYHLVVDGLALRAPKAPLWLAAGAALVAVIGSIGVDALDAGGPDHRGDGGEAP